MKDQRDTEQEEEDRTPGPTRTQVVITILTTVAAIAGCVEQLAR